MMRYRSLLILPSRWWQWGILAGVLAAAVSGETGVPYWNWRNPLPQGNDFQAVTYGAGRFVAVGAGGAIVSSPDGVHWEQAYSTAKGYLNDVAYGAGTFVVIGYPLDGTLVSADGTFWRAAPVLGSAGAEWRKVSTLTFAAGRFWAMSSNLHFVATSVDGVTWTEHAAASAANLARIAEHDGILVATDTSNGLLGSPDGVSWNYQLAHMATSSDGGETWMIGAPTALAVVSAGPVWSGDRWLVAGTEVVASGGTTSFFRTLCSSVDQGQTWTVAAREPSPWNGNAPVYDLEAFGDRAYLLGIQDRLLTSTTDGSALTSEWSDGSGPPIQINDLQAGGDTLVGVGRYGRLAWTRDGHTWTLANESTVQGDLRAAAYGDGRWIVAGNVGLATSVDGRDWHMVAGTERFGGGALAYGNGRFVTSGAGNQIEVSTDGGITWAHNADFEASLRRVTFGNGRFVGLVTPKGGREQIHTSTDGLSWTPATGLDAWGWQRVEYILGLFYAVGGPVADDTGGIMRSADGLTWTLVGTAPSPVFAIAGQPNRYVAGTRDGEVLTSSLGLDWRVLAGRPLAAAGPPASFEAVGDRIVGVTYYGRVVATDDGWRWETEDFSGAGMIFELAQGNGQLLAVGNGGVIWESGTARFSNNSSRSHVATGDEILIAGFVVGGTGRAQVLVRAAGPALRALGVEGALTRPVLQVIQSGGNPSGVNAGWWRRENAAEIAAAANVVGAFPFAEHSEDSALLLGLDPGAYTALVSGVDGETGVGLVEVYAIEGGTGHLINISTRSRVGTGEDILITGFVVQGDAPQQILIRGIGPTLTTYGVEDALPHPILRVLAGKTELATNAGWNLAVNADEIRQVSARLGAFALEEGAADAALLITLPPGVYTVHVAGTAEETGVALAEIYEVR